MINGIKVLEEVHVVGNIGWVVFGAFLCVLFIAACSVFLWAIRNKQRIIERNCDPRWKAICMRDIKIDRAFFIIMLTMGVSLLSTCIYKHCTTDYVEYRVLIENSCSYNEFTSKYEVIKTFDDGSVTIREK